MTEDHLLRVLGVDGTTGRPLDPVPESEARRWVERARPRPPRYGVATGDLSSAAWGVVVPEGVDAEVLDALEPLLEHRQRQAGELYQQLTYRAGEDAATFRSRLRASFGRVDPRQVPWYLLLVGSPDEIPHGFELDLSLPHAIGRLAFDDPNDLAAYAERVVAAERQQLDRVPRAALCAPSHPGDTSTRQCIEYLAQPLLELLDRRIPCTHLIGEAARRDSLLELIHGAPDLLIFAGHGTAFGYDSPSQLALQGSLVCADWPGQDAIPAEYTVTAADLQPGALPGGIAILFGCHTVGTPRYDIFDSVEKSHPLASRAFVSAIAQRLLGREGGALAVIGHVGRAFEASFVWRGVPQINPFEDTLHALLDGCRLGEALDGFGQRYAELGLAWNQSRLDGASPAPDPLDLWRAYNDAHSWSLIGDPAVRLPAANGKTARGKTTNGNTTNGNTTNGNTTNGNTATG
ncbi:MAG: hypothetical protein AAF560_22550 [Acidobacteriota bacterium]